jgi:hypothetical protein
MHSSQVHDVLLLCLSQPTRPRCLQVHQQQVPEHNLAPVHACACVPRNMSKEAQTTPWFSPMLLNTCSGNALLRYSMCVDVM